MPSSFETEFDSVNDAIADIAAGRLVIVTDDEDRENEGDLIMAAEKATPETINMMIRYGSGIVCVPTVESRLKQFGLGPMVQRNRDSFRTDFTASVDAASGISTGISAMDRTRTIKLLADPQGTPETLVQPGHVFPLRARPGGILERAGHTEAAVDLCVLAGLAPVGVLCELVNDDGTVQRLPQLLEFKKRFGIKIISIASLIAFRAKNEQLVRSLTAVPFESEFGDFVLHTFESAADGRRHYALTAGTLDSSPVLVRVHGADTPNDVFRGKKSGGAGMLHASMQEIAKQKRGVILYVQGENKTIPSPFRENEAEQVGHASLNLRDYGIGAQILHILGVRRMRLISTNRRKVVGLEGYGLEIVEQVVLDR